MSSEEGQRGQHEEQAGQWAGRMNAQEEHAGQQEDRGGQAKSLTVVKMLRWSLSRRAINVRHQSNKWGASFMTSAGASGEVGKRFAGGGEGGVVRAPLPSGGGGGPGMIMPKHWWPLGWGVGGRFARREALQAHFPDPPGWLRERRRASGVAPGAQTGPQGVGRGGSGYPHVSIPKDDRHHALVILRHMSWGQLFCKLFCSGRFGAQFLSQDWSSDCQCIRSVTGPVRPVSVPPTTVLLFPSPDRWWQTAVEKFRLTMPTTHARPKEKPSSAAIRGGDNDEEGVHPAPSVRRVRANGPQGHRARVHFRVRRNEPRWLLAQTRRRLRLTTLRCSIFGLRMSVQTMNGCQQGDPCHAG